MTARITALALSLAAFTACDDVDGAHQEFDANVDVTVTERAQADFAEYPAVVVAAFVIDSRDEDAFEIGHRIVAVLDAPGADLTGSVDLYASLGPCIARDVRVVAFLAPLDEVAGDPDVSWGVPTSTPVEIDAIEADARCGPFVADDVKLTID